MALTKYRVGTTVTIAPATVIADHSGGKTISGASWSSLSGAGLVAVTTDADADHSAISN